MAWQNELYTAFYLSSGTSYMPFDVVCDVVWDAACDAVWDVTCS